MRSCYFSKRYSIYRKVNYIFGTFLGCFVFLLGIFLKDVGWTWRCVVTASGVTIIAYTGMFAAFMSRKYDLSEKGITIEQTYRRTVVHPWEKIQFVCVCVTHRSGTGTTQDTVILCSTRKFAHPFSADVRLRTSWEYDFLHSNSVITIEYSEERLEEFAFYYQKFIPDFRKCVIEAKHSRSN